MRLLHPSSLCRITHFSLTATTGARAQNSGHEQYVSLYLSCEPTEAEKERALSERPDHSTALPSAGSSDVRLGKDSGKEKDRMPWKRDGHFKFTFEVSFISSTVGCMLT